MGWCERKQTDCDMWSDISICNTDICLRKLPDATITPVLYDPTGTGLVAVGNQDLNSNTIEISGCEHIYLTQSGIDVKFELNNDNLKKFKRMYINGIGFLRSEAFFEELEDRLPKGKKLDRYDVLDIIQDLLEEWKQ